MRIHRVLVGVDGSEHARRAVEWAAGLARALDAEVVACVAVGLLARDDAGAPVPAAAHRDELRAHLEGSWSEPLREAGVRHRLELRDGPPVATLLGLADEVEADLVVLGTRGTGAVADLALGSTSAQVAQQARVPVVVVPRRDG